MYFFQLFYTDYFYEKHKTNQVYSIAKKIEKNLNDLPNYFEKTSIENDVCISHLSQSSSYLYNENLKGCILENPNSRILTLMDEMYSSKKTTMFYKITNPVYNTKTFLYGTRLSDGSYIFINSQLENLDKTSVILSGQLIYLLLIVIILSIVIAFFISNAITKPILKITDKAKKMGKGDLNVVFESSNISEIDELSETLNFARDEMKKTDDYRRDLMANVSHDLKTPLTLIRSYAEMVRDLTYKDDIKREEHLNVIINETDRLNNLVNDILVLSKLESNAEELDIEKYDMIAQIKEVISKFEILEITENYNFIYSGPETAIIEADRDKMSQVIYNLVNNAINYTGDDMNVYINVTKNRHGYLVEIIDTGKGIDSETIKHVWNRYYKTEKKHKRNKIGTGLGLSIVREILEKHNFKYGVKSTVGKGTNFYFTVKHK